MASTLNLGSGVSLKASSTYLEQTGTCSPVVSAYVPNQSAQSLSDATWTKNTWLTTETVDSAGAFTSSRFTVPAGRGGYYFITTSANLYSDGNNMRNGWVAIYKNGSRIVGSYNIVMAGDQDLRHFSSGQSTILNLAENDYIEQYMYLDVTSGSLYLSSDGNGVRGNYLIIYKL